MMKFAVVSALLVFSSTQVQSGILGGLGGYAGGGDEGYGGGSLTAAASYQGIGDLGSATASLDSSLVQSGGDGGDFHGGTSIVGGGGGQQGQTLDLTGHAGDHSGKIYGGSFISASVGGHSGSYASAEGGDSSGGLDIHGLGGGNGGYEGLSSYDVGHGGGDGEIASVLTSSYHGDLGGAGGHFGGYH